MTDESEYVRLYKPLTYHGCNNCGGFIPVNGTEVGPPEPFYACACLNPDTNRRVTYAETSIVPYKPPDFVPITFDIRYSKSPPEWADVRNPKEIEED